MWLVIAAEVDCNKFVCECVYCNLNQNRYRNNNHTLRLHRKSPIYIYHRVMLVLVDHIKNGAFKEYYP